MRLRIFYIDDEAVLCENFKDLHASDEVEVEAFTNPEAAIEAVRANPPDLMFIDYRLPGTTGEQVATVMNVSKPIILITGELDIKTTYPFHMIIHKSAETNQVIETIDYFKKFNQQKAA
jgi:DNA-binding NtrC family response regulator